MRVLWFLIWFIICWWLIRFLVVLLVIVVRMWLGVMLVCWWIFLRFSVIIGRFVLSCVSMGSGRVNWWICGRMVIFIFNGCSLICCVMVMVRWFILLVFLLILVFVVMLRSVCVICCIMMNWLVWLIVGCFVSGCMRWFSGCVRRRVGWFCCWLIWIVLSCLMIVLVMRLLISCLGRWFSVCGVLCWKLIFWCVWLVMSLLFFSMVVLVLWFCCVWLNVCWFSCVSWWVCLVMSWFLVFCWGLVCFLSRYGKFLCWWVRWIWWCNMLSNLVVIFFSFFVIICRIVFLNVCVWKFGCVRWLRRVNWMCIISLSCVWLVVVWIWLRCWCVGIILRRVWFCCWFLLVLLRSVGWLVRLVNLFCVGFVCRLLSGVSGVWICGFWWIFWFISCVRVICLM